MRITSPAFENNQPLPPKYACDGEDVNPPLVISGVPEGAKSLALIVDDPDASGGTWTHWLLWNIPPLTPMIEKNSVPPGTVEGTTSFGKTVYGGPCPPSGTHRYFFKLYALDTLLDLPSETTAEGLEAAFESHVLDKAGLVGLYKRQK